MPFLLAGHFVGVPVILIRQGVDALAQTGGFRPSFRQFDEVLLDDGFMLFDALCGFMELFLEGFYPVAQTGVSCRGFVELAMVVLLLILLRFCG